MTDRVAWTIHPITGSDEEGGYLYALLPDDATDGIIIGEAADVGAVIKRLLAFSHTGQHDGAISDLDPRLGAKWLTTVEACEGWGVARSTLTWACRTGRVREARKGHRGWEFPQRSFLSWLKRRPGRDKK